MFSGFEAAPLASSLSRKAITAATFRPEPDCLAPLIEQARVPSDKADRIRHTAERLVTGLRENDDVDGVAELVQEFGLSNQEGVALMCLAEALLRIPDEDTREALIRDKIAPGDWRSHLGRGRSLFVNAATWGLVVSGRLIAPVNERGLSAALTRLIARAGEPVIRESVTLAMRMMGEQFVTGRTIEEALSRAKRMEAKGYTYSFDMLGEAARTAADAQRYYEDYERAIHEIGAQAAGRGIYQAPGISIKLSALHPRYERSQIARVHSELLPRVAELARLAKSYDIGFNIDAEEADRLDLSLDILEILARDETLADWQGLGFVVQAYGKRCPEVIEHLIALAKKTGRRLMIRLVKGAYWDTEIKRAQVDGLPDFPVFTRKAHTDVCFIACVKRLLDAREHVFPQFATHNAQTLATIHEIAGEEFAIGDWEFQCLHGMGEPLYDQVVGGNRLDRPCRIYAPVGSHETLLAYLVRRLLENGANSSFVHRIHDENVPLDDLVIDPVELVLGEENPGSPNPQIAMPGELYPERANSSGIALWDESELSRLDAAFGSPAASSPVAGPEGKRQAIVNPSDMRDVVGHCAGLDPEEVAAAVDRAVSSDWSNESIEERAAILERAADLIEDAMPSLMALVMREAGKTAANAVGEVREAVDFLRYYALQAQESLTAEHRPVGPIAAISPWNFPLAIFLGQVSAALVAGNPVLAKPAEETPLIAAEAVRLLHQAGIPEDALILVTGAGEVGAALVANLDVQGVVFTGSTEVARSIQSELNKRLSPEGRPIPLIAETGGQNAMVVDSSALTEQVVRDVVASAFDSAGQRCSALRLLCLQDEIYDTTMTMLRGALAELNIGPSTNFACDVGPVISVEARKIIETHVAHMQETGCKIDRSELGEETSHGTFVAPTIVELDHIGQLGREVFGPVLHVVRWKRGDLEGLIDSINALGYGLTFGVHSRIDEFVGRCAAQIEVGNIYVNRNIVGAVVGVQPFGGCGLSGTGPKAGGPLYLGRLVTGPDTARSVPGLPEASRAFAAWLDERGEVEAAQIARDYGKHSPLGPAQSLPGPVGETDLYHCEPRGTVLARAGTAAGLYGQVAASLATGNRVAVDILSPMDALTGLPAEIADMVEPYVGQWVDAALLEGTGGALVESRRQLSEIDGPIVIAQGGNDPAGWRLDWLVHEVSRSTDTTAAGGNASLMALPG